MARIRGAGNRDTELRLIALMRAAGIAGWRRGTRLRFTAEPDSSTRRSQRSRGEMRRSGKEAEFQSDSVASATSVCKVRAIVIRPDFVFRAERLAVFVDGCFWHGCPKHATWPRQNAAFWRAKIEGNIARDRRVDRALRAAGWRVLHLWEHALTPRHAARTVSRLRRALAAAVTHDEARD